MILSRKHPFLCALVELGGIDYTYPVKTLSVEQQSGEVAALVQQAKQEEEIVFTLSQQPVARLLPIKGNAAQPQFGCLRGKIWLAPDFDAPMDDFRDYMP